MSIGKLGKSLDSYQNLTYKPASAPAKTADPRTLQEKVSAITPDFRTHNATKRQIDRWEWARKQDLPDFLYVIPEGTEEQEKVAADGIDEGMDLEAEETLDLSATTEFTFSWTKAPMTPAPELSLSETSVDLEINFALLEEVIRRANKLANEYDLTILELEQERESLLKTAEENRANIEKFTDTQLLLEANQSLIDSETLIFEKTVQPLRNGIDMCIQRIRRIQAELALEAENQPQELPSLSLQPTEDEPALHLPRMNSKRKSILPNMGSVSLLSSSSASPFAQLTRDDRAIIDAIIENPEEIQLHRSQQVDEFLRKTKKIDKIAMERLYTAIAPEDEGDPQGYCRWYFARPDCAERLREFLSNESANK